MTERPGAEHGRLPLGAILLLALLAVYGPDMGRGFIKDDFVWIAGSRVESPADLAAIFSRDNGFYRPIVSLTFALNEWLFGLAPFGYAATNLLLVVLCAGTLAVLAGRLGLNPHAALAAAALWAFNPHGIGGAVLWISGRTALLLCLFALLAALALVGGRLATSALLALAALFCKEEAILLPVILSSWVVVGGPFRRPGSETSAEEATGRWRRALVVLAALSPGVGIYLLARARTAAYTFTSAPDFYTPTLNPAHLLRNVGEYLDRAATFPVAVVLLSMLLAAVRPGLRPSESRVIRLGALWFAGAYGLTVFLPVRSSLYACFPSLGAALAAGALLQAVGRGTARDGRRRLVVGAWVAVLLLVPLLRSRNVRLKKTALLSAHVLKEVSAARPELRAGDVLVLQDSANKVNLRAAFGTLLDVALGLTPHTAGAAVWIEPPPPDWEAAGLRPPGEGRAIVYRLEGHTLVRLKTPRE